MSLIGVDTHMNSIHMPAVGLILQSAFLYASQHSYMFFCSSNELHVSYLEFTCFDRQYNECARCVTVIAPGNWENFEACKANNTKLHLFDWRGLRLLPQGAVSSTIPLAHNYCQSR